MSSGSLTPADADETSNDLAVAESTVATNLLGPIRMLNAFAPFLVGRDDAVVMNVSSGLAFVPLPITPTNSATKAAIHSFTESLRVQLADTPVQVIELIPPLVRTALMGSENDERGMPLDDYLSEGMALLQAQPDAEQILVERVKRQRSQRPTAPTTPSSPCRAGADHPRHAVARPGRPRVTEASPGARCPSVVGGGRAVLPEAQRVAPRVGEPQPAAARHLDGELAAVEQVAVRDPLAGAVHVTDAEGQADARP